MSIPFWELSTLPENSSLYDKAIKSRNKNDTDDPFLLGETYPAEIAPPNSRGEFRPAHPGRMGHNNYGEYLDWMGHHDPDFVDPVTGNRTVPFGVIILRNEKGEIIAAQIEDGTHRALQAMKDSFREIPLMIQA